MRSTTRKSLLRILLILGIVAGLVYTLFLIVWMISCAFKQNMKFSQ